jgi:hypothetical protein
MILKHDLVHTVLPSATNASHYLIPKTIRVNFARRTLHYSHFMHIKSIKPMNTLPFLHKEKKKRETTSTLIRYLGISLLRKVS